MPVVIAQVSSAGAVCHSGQHVMCCTRGGTVHSLTSSGVMFILAVYFVAVSAQGRGDRGWIKRQVSWALMSLPSIPGHGRNIDLRTCSGPHTARTMCRKSGQVASGRLLSLIVHRCDTCLIGECACLLRTYVRI